ncbi:response regulator [Sphingomonas jatrophae]|uniref:Response regulator receiver domain-containing protein n=1 Tax=Sphingomonas jatrophae TaxID=1166337 RepID=A0A1I6LAI7_9SPHN|nr:response regulator [Sphingomonas jatrophae]SFS00258.1 Response regulator receiver domain-containing protein [Sphingomonas jatrophae]
MIFGRRKRRIERILIVEDEPLVAFDNEHVLGDAGYRVVATVDTVADAVAALEDGADLVLADVSLSDGGNGIDVAQAAKARGTPLLFVTGACPVDAQALAVGCLAKPYSQRDLLAAIEAVDARLGGERVRRAPPGLTLFEA